MVGKASQARIAAAAPDGPSAGSAQPLVPSASEAAWREAQARLQACAPAAVDAALAGQVLAAALAVRTEAAIAEATRCLAQAQLSIEERIGYANRLAQANHGVQALMVLTADPATFNSVAEVSKVLFFVGQAADPAGVGVAVAHAARRRLNPPAASHYRPSGLSRPSIPTPPELRGPPTVLHLGPGVPEPVADGVRSALRDRDAFHVGGRLPPLRELHEVYVNASGHIWAKDGTVIHLPAGQLSAASQAAAARAPVIDAAVFGGGGERSTNLFHWLAETLPWLAWHLDGGTSDLPILVGAGARPWVRESIQLAADREVPVLDMTDAVFVRRLVIPGVGLGVLAHHASYDRMFARMISRAEALVPPQPTGPIYISRRDATRRPMVNEAELEEALVRRGTRIVRLTGRSMAEKIRIIRDSGAVVAPHGAGLTMLAFAAPGRTVAEILPMTMPALRVRTCMANISRMVGHRHHVWLDQAQQVRNGWAVSLTEALDYVDRTLAL